MVATFAKEYLGCEKEYVRPDGLLLGYPVITAGKNAAQRFICQAAR